MVIAAKGRKRVERAPRTLSQGLQNYHKVLRTVRDLYPYRYRDAQKLASKIYKSGIDPNSKIEIMKDIQRADEQRFTNLQSEFNRLVEEASPYNVHIERMRKAFKGIAQSYSVSVIDKSDPLAQMIKARGSTIELLNKILESLGGFKFTETLKITLKKNTINKNGETEYTYKTAYFNSKAETIINTNQIKNSLNISQEAISNTIGIWMSEGSGWN